MPIKLQLVPQIFQPSYGPVNMSYVPQPLFTNQRYTYRVLQTIKMKVILLWVWAEGAVLGRAKTTLKFKYEIQIG